MIRHILLFSFLLFGSVLVAQDIPQAFRYQAVLRDASDNLIANQNVSVLLDLFQNDVSVYQEVHNVNTNNLGLVNLSIGQGQAITGEFSGVDWGETTLLNMQVDPAGGSDYTDFGRLELLSVPYALYAGNAGNDADTDPNNEIELPQGAVAGDIAFFNGTDWVSVPEGKGGQMLSLSNDGTPYWSGNTTEQLLQTIPANGQIIYVHPTVNNTSIGFNPSMTFRQLSELEDIAFSSTSLALNDFAGEANTNFLVNVYGEGNYAAKVCYDLEAFGFDDWFLPAVGEMEQIYRNFSNDVGDKTFAGPIRYFTSSVSTQTSGIVTISYGFNSSGNISVLNNNGKAQVLCVRK